MMSTDNKGIIRAVVKEVLERRDFAAFDDSDLLGMPATGKGVEYTSVDIDRIDVSPGPAEAVA